MNWVLKARGRKRFPSRSHLYANVLVKISQLTTGISCSGEHLRPLEWTHREKVAECHMREDLVSSVLRTLALALPPELLEFFQQGPRGAEEERILLGDGVIQRRVTTVAMQPATENTVVSTGAVPIEDTQQQ